MADLEYVTQLTEEEQIQQLHHLFQDEWWSRGRSLEDTKRVLRFSDFVFAVRELPSRRLVAFARVLTDRVFKALIFDVIVAPEYRGRGMGAQLLRRILEHPELAQVQHLELYCLPELVPFYERWGFSTDVGKIRLMRRERPARIEGDGS